MSDVDALLRLVDGKSAVKVRQGQFVGLDGTHAVVDVGAQRSLASFWDGWSIPGINDTVNVLTVDGQSFMVGGVLPRPGVGVVATVGDPKVTVTTEVGVISMTYAGEAPTSGDVVGIVWPGLGEPWCIKLATSPEEPAPAPNPGAGVGAKVQTVTFKATDTGSVAKGSGSWWQSRPWNSPSNYGCWFYGTAIRDTIPDDAQMLGFEMYLSWAARRWMGTLRWGLHDLSVKSGAPRVEGQAAWDPGRDAGWFTPPWAADWFTALARGTWYGIALNAAGSGKEEAKSRAEDPFTGALRIKWKA